MVLAARHDGELHLVAGEGEHGVALCHEYRGCTVVGNDGVLAVRLALESAFLHLSVLVELIGAFAFPDEEVVPCHFLHHVNGEHLCGMRVETERTEYFLETILLFGILQEEVLELIYNLLLVKSFSSFSTFCHNSKVLY